MKHGTQTGDERGPIAWMAQNSVAANLLMLVLLVGGLLLGLRIKQEIFPEFNLDMVNISLAYPGASPEEVEQGIILAVEEAVQGLDGVDELTATASEGLAVVTVQAVEGTDITRLWQDIKSEVDRIDTLPDDALEPQVTIASRKRAVLTLALYGQTHEYNLREAADHVRDELLLNPGITQVDFSGVRNYEVQIEIGQDTLRRYGLTLKNVAAAITKASVELGGGSIKTAGGDILLRVKDRREYAREFARLPVLTQADGSQILVEDIAHVKEGFEDTDTWASYNGQRAVLIQIYQVGDQTPKSVSDAAKTVLEKMNAALPQGLHLTILNDSSKIFVQRADLLLRNALSGLTLVFICLALFLEIRLAFWVSLGIPVSFLGSFLILSPLGFSINMVTMFAFIVTLGIVVDDAIVVGENVYHYRQQGLPYLTAALKGAGDVSMPVVFSVLTNMVAFLPLFFVPGIMGKVFKFIPAVVVCVFGVSLIESLLVLPAHLGHRHHATAPWPLSYLEKGQERFSRLFEKFVQKGYGELLARLLKQRYAVLATGIAMLIATAGYMASGRMGMVMFPKVESDYAFCKAVLPYGTPEARLATVERRLREAAENVVGKNGGSRLSEGIFSQVNNNDIQIRVYLTPTDERPIGTSLVTTLWRQQTGTIPGLESISFASDRGGPGHGKGLTIRLSHPDQAILEKAGEELARRLREFPIVHDIDDGSAKGKRQFDIHLLPAGERMGLTSQEVANQIRYAFQGVEALKQQRGHNEVTVRVRLPEKERVTEATLEDMILQAPRGEILLRDAVKMTPGRAYTAIQRSNGRRIIEVTGDVRPQSQSENIINALKKDLLPQLKTRYPRLSYSFEGHQAEIRDSVRALIMGLGMALLGIYALLAIPFKSYIQPMIIMFCIPFGIIGAVMGHIIMGYSLSVISLFGLVALSGVVVNDSLVLIDMANRLRRSDLQPMEAVIQAGIQRFRPILLTTLTTFGGLAPMIMETSRQARFLIPMAISLGFGILFSTFITLMMVPSLYLLLENVKLKITGISQPHKSKAPLLIPPRNNQ